MLETPRIQLFKQTNDGHVSRMRAEKIKKETKSNEKNIPNTHKHNIMTHSPNDCVLYLIFQTQIQC